MSGIMQIAGTNPRRIGLPGFDVDDNIGNAYWGTVVDGTEINMSKAAAVAQANFLRVGASMLPLVPPIPDGLIRKAIFDHGFSGETQKEYVDETGKLRDEMTKALRTDTEDINKAMTTSSGLIHQIVDEDYVLQYKRPYPFQALIPAESTRGKGVSWDVIPPYEFGSASTGTEDQSFTESDLTPYNRTDTVKYLYAVGRVTQAAELSGLSAVPPRDLMAIRVDAAQDAIRALRERLMLSVDRTISQTTNTFVDATSLEYAGIYEKITTNTSYSNWVDGTGVTTYAGMMEKLDNTFKNLVLDGVSPNLALCDYTTFGVIRRGLTEYFRTDPVQTFTQGISKISLVFPNDGGLPLVPHPFLPMASGSGCIILMDTRMLARRVLWQDMYTELAKLNLSKKFVISAAETFIDKSDKDGSNSLHGGVFNLN